MGRSRLVHVNRQPYDVYIGRPSKWGNPFRSGIDGTKSEVIAKYKEWIQTQPLMNDLHELDGKVLACWCTPSRCHGEVLLELLEERQRNKLLEF